MNPRSNSALACLTSNDILYLVGQNSVGTGEGYLPQGQAEEPGRVLWVHGRRHQGPRHEEGLQCEYSSLLTQTCKQEYGSEG